MNRSRPKGTTNCNQLFELVPHIIKPCYCGVGHGANPIVPDESFPLHLRGSIVEFDQEKQEREAGVFYSCDLGI